MKLRRTYDPEGGLEKPDSNPLDNELQTKVGSGISSVP
jgi:hypothetical protein